MRGAFTLIELVVVIAVIAIVTHLAVREFADVREQKLRAAADEQLEEIRQAASDYLSDMGEVLSTTNGTLDALWRLPAGAKPYAVVKTGDGVYVGAGWRGPYLRIPFGRSRLYDPWGNAVEWHDGDRFVRLAITNEVIFEVAHYGRDPMRGERVARALPTGDEAAARLFVTVVSKTGSSGTATVTWYAPKKDATVASGTGTVTIGSGYEFSGLTPGRRIVSVAAGPDKVQVEVELRSGDNKVEIRVP